MQTITLFSGLALKDVLEDSLLVPFLERSDLNIERVYEPTKVLYDLIQDGARPDIIIGVTSALHDMADDGYVQATSIRGLVRSDVGVAVALGAAQPALQTEEDFAQMLRDAKSVAYSSSGASGGVFQRVLADQGLSDLVAEKAVVQAKGFTAEAVRDGHAELAIQQISELAAVEGVDIVGPLPPLLKAYVELSIAVGADTGDTGAVGELIEHLRSPVSASVYEQGFMQQVR